VLDKAEYSAFESTFNSSIVSYRMSCRRGCIRHQDTNTGSRWP